MWTDECTKKNWSENRKGSDHLGVRHVRSRGGVYIKMGLEKLCRCVALIQLVDGGDFVNMSKQLGFHKIWEYLAIKYPHVPISGKTLHSALNILTLCKKKSKFYFLTVSNTR